MTKELNRVFTPNESDAVYEAIQKRKFKRAFDTALNSGMRYKELRLLVEHPEWHRAKKVEVFIPKVKSKTRFERYVHLTESFNKLLSEYLDIGLYFPDRRTWYDSVRRWAKKAGIEDWQNVNVKTTRKTWECWLMRSEYDPIKILLNQGHTQTTAILHYLNLSFTPREIENIKQKTHGWSG